jgi:hypothetical protein
MEQAKLTASDAAPHDRLGFSVALSGDTVIAGAPGPDILPTVSGAAYVFTRNGTTWTQQAKLRGADATVGSRLGRSVAVAGDRALIGGQGMVYVFDRHNGAWHQREKLAATPADTSFGVATAISGDAAVVGAQFAHTAAGQSSGAAFIFTLD